MSHFIEITNGIPVADEDTVYADYLVPFPYMLVNPHPPIATYSNSYSFFRIER